MYFSRFPKLEYSSTGSTTDAKIVTHLLRRVAIRQSLDDDMKLMDDYFVKEGETPENVAHKHFGSAKFHWVILLTNNITDRYYGWPLSIQEFEKYIYDKYDNPEAVHHYEKVQSSGSTTQDGPGNFNHVIEVNSDDADGQSVSNYEYEQRLQDQKRQIKLLDKAYLNTFVEEFERLVKR